MDGIQPSITDLGWLWAYTGSVFAGLAKQYEHLVVVFSRGPFAETGSGYGIGSADPSVDSQARDGDVSSGSEFALGGSGELVRLGGVGADLGG